MTLRLTGRLDEAWPLAMRRSRRWRRLWPEQEPALPPEPDDGERDGEEMGGEGDAPVKEEG